MKLTRKQELSLINLGFQKLLEQLESSTVRKPNRKPREKKSSRKWSDAQREKFRATMQKVWARKRAKK